MPSQLLSKESEKRLINALEKVATLTNDGVHPDEAITKVASEARIPSGHIHLMVNAVNTGRTNAQRMTADDPLEKAAEFPLANVTNILNKLYPDEILTKKAEVLNTTVSIQYNQSPRWLREKAASAIAKRPIDWKMTDKKPVVERDPLHQMKKAMGAAQKLHQNLEQQKMELTKHRNDAIKIAEDLREYFRKTDHIPYTQVSENALIMFGKQAQPILDMLEQHLPVKVKTASVKELLPVNINKAPYSLFTQAIKLADSFNTKLAAYETNVKTANEEVKTLLRPFGPGPEQGHSVLADLFSKTNDKLASFGDFIGKGFGLMSGGDVAKEIGRNMPVSTPSSDLKQRDMQDLMDPSHENEIRNIQAEALLNDLLANDDVIKGYDPEESIDAFNEVSQLAPYATGNKPIIRDLMRKRLAGGTGALDQFLVGDTLGQQQKLRELTAPNPNQVSVLRDIGAFPNGQQHGSSGPSHGKSK